MNTKKIVLLLTLILCLHVQFANCACQDGAPDSIRNSNFGQQCDGGAGCTSQCLCDNTIGVYEDMNDFNSTDCVSQCGDSIIAFDEQCDGEQGCDSLCMCDNLGGFSAKVGGGCQTDCTDNIRATTQQCLSTGDGCDPITCLCNNLQGFYTNLNDLTASDCVTRCGDGIRATGEECDGGDGCDAVLCTCDSAPGYYLNADNANPTCETDCSDSIRAGDQECDNVAGCTSGCVCQNSAGFYEDVTSDANQCVTPECGNQIETANEQCDDPSDQNCVQCQCINGRQNSPDNASCIEVCGNGVVSSSEQCDTIPPSIYCNVDCKIKDGYSCNITLGKPPVCSGVCENGIKTSDQECDGGPNNPGCIKCKITDGWLCPYNQNGGTSVCEKSKIPIFCGNGIWEPSNKEQCDNKGGAGCFANCTIRPGYVCTGVFSVCQRCGNGVVEGNQDCDSSPGCPPTCKYAVCNNGFLQSGEICDNGGGDGDGCSSKCKLEIFYTCEGLPNLGKPSACRKIYQCGNGKFQPFNFEQCDNGNKTGCINCIVADDYTCDSQRNQLSNCSKVVISAADCGNGNLNIYEKCDDGDRDNGDGCDSNCQIQPNFICPRFYLCFDLTVRQCGNGLVQPVFNEQCDDTNNVNGDGCSSDCRIETGFGCVEDVSFLFSVCKNKCGDGALSFSDGEVCDDNNNFDGDGCSADCKRFEPFFGCQIFGEGFRTICRYQDPTQVLCGNGRVETSQGQQCDDANNNDNDGCSGKYCRIEPMWICRPVIDQDFTGLTGCCPIRNPFCSLHRNP